MKMYLTMCGRQQKISQKGMEYGWSSTVFCTTGEFFGMKMYLRKQQKLRRVRQLKKIKERVFMLNPNGEVKDFEIY